MLKTKRLKFNLKRTLSLALAVSIILTMFTGLFSVQAGAATSGYYTYSVSNGKATITDVDTSISGNVTIPSTLGGYSVTSIGSSTFSGCTGLTSITIPDSVTSVGWYAFEDCTGLTSVTIGDGVTSIGERAFSGCTGLTNISVSEGNNNYFSVDGVLYNKDKSTLICYPCSKEGSQFTIPDSVTYISNYAFYGCTGLTSIVIPNSVTSIGGYAFEDCTGLTDVYYTGTQEQWNAIDIGSYNTPLTSDNIHFNYKPLSSISVYTKPTKTSYYVGESLDTTGLVLQLTYNDNSTESVTTGFTTSGFDSTTAGTKTVTVTYNGKTATFDVTVNEVVNLGDANGDGNVDAIDATLILQQYAGIATIQSNFTANADVNKDGNIDAIDATLILQYYANIISSFA